MKKRFMLAAPRLRVAANEKAEAEKILQIKNAEGDAESKYLSGIGVARSTQAIIDGLRDTVLAFSRNVAGTSAKDVLDMLLVTHDEGDRGIIKVLVRVYTTRTGCCQRHRCTNMGGSSSS